MTIYFFITYNKEYNEYCDAFNPVVQRINQNFLKSAGIHFKKFTTEKCKGILVLDKNSDSLFISYDENKNIDEKYQAKPDMLPNFIIVIREYKRKIGVRYGAMSGPIYSYSYEVCLIDYSMGELVDEYPSKDHPERTKESAIEEFLMKAKTLINQQKD